LKDPFQVDGNLYTMISDERHVPTQAPEHNFAVVREMLDKLGLDDSRMLRPDTSLGLDHSALVYHRDIQHFLDVGGTTPLGILGIGSDGHVASLFSMDDLDRGELRYAVGVEREDGPDRISLTTRFFQTVSRIVFFVAGRDKEDIVKKMENDPETVVAGRAMLNVPDVELWYCPEPEAEE
jgi:6-phosphogluconolactonase/glucosamine-6-phosphate isomerase/deaminase